MEILYILSENMEIVASFGLIAQKMNEYTLWYNDKENPSGEKTETFLKPFVASMVEVSMSYWLV